MQVQKHFIINLRNFTKLNIFESRIVPIIWWCVEGPSWVMGIPEMQGGGIGLTPSPPIGTPYFWNAPTLKGVFPMVKKKKRILILKLHIFPSFTI